ncbi:unnamed protein product [Pylaiella littoralis]
MCCVTARRARPNPAWQQGVETKDRVSPWGLTKGVHKSNKVYPPRFANTGPHETVNPRTEGVENIDATVCCDADCGYCGGKGCSARAQPLGATDCSTSE